MQINAINSMNFKGYNQEIIDLQQQEEIPFNASSDYDTSFENSEGYNQEVTDYIYRQQQEKAQHDASSDIDKFVKATELTKKLVDSEDMKTPVQAAVAIGYAGAKTFAKGAFTGLAIDSLFAKNNPSNFKPSDLFESGLKRISKGVKNVASNLLSNEGKKFSKIANCAGDLLNKTENYAKQAYKTISKNNPAKGLGFAFGALSLLAFFPALLKKDGNEDGVADIMQKSQNVYTESSQKLDKFQEKASVAAEIVQLLS